MDSGNSGSLQSSSGGDEECDSRAAVGYTHHQPHPPPPPFNHHVFDQNQINNPLFFAASSQQDQLLGLDTLVWSKTLPSFSDQQFFNSDHRSTLTVPFPPEPAATTAPIMANPAPPARNPKKRSRASRRAPTTVLTTDTNNFRAMVQEFTGIPAPPFTSPSSAFPRALTGGFDLFGRSSSVRSNVNNFDNLPQLPPYLLRPFPHKLQSSPPSSSSISSLLDSGINPNSNTITMQNTGLYPSNSLNQTASFLNPKATQNVLSSGGFGLIGQPQTHGLHSSLPDLVSSTPTAPASATGNWDAGGGVNYTDGKESSRVTSTADHNQPSGMKGNQDFVKPWVCSSE